MFRVHVAHGHHLHVGAAEDLAQIPLDAVVAAADKPQADPLAGSGRAVEAQGRQGIRLGTAHVPARAAAP